MWVPPEVKNPILLHARTHKIIDYWEAVRLRDSKLVYRWEPGTFEGPPRVAFLEQFYGASTRGPRRAVVISDNTSYRHSRIHKDWRAERTGRFELSFLPAASPQLNPIERVWKLTRRRRLHNWYFPTLDSITEAVESTFDEWHALNETLRRLCAINSDATFRLVGAQVREVGRRGRAEECDASEGKGAGPEGTEVAVESGVCRSERSKESPRAG